MKSVASPALRRAEAEARSLRNDLSLRADEAVAVKVAILVGILCFASALVFPGMQADDYRWATGIGGSRKGILNSGRWLFYTWAELKDWERLPAISWTVHMVAATAGGLVLARLWSVRGRLALGLTVTMFVISPAFVEFGTWDQMVGITAVASAAGLIGIYLIQRTIYWLPVAAAGVAATLATYQAILSMVIAVVVLQLLLIVLRRERWRSFFRVALPSLAAGVAGVLLYAVLSVIAVALGAPFGRAGGGVSGPAEWAGRVVAGWHEAVVPVLGGSLPVAAVCLIGVATLIFEIGVRKREPLRALLLLLLLATATVAAFTHQLVSPDLLPSGWSPRGLLALFLFPPFFLVVTGELRSKIARVVVAALCIVVSVMWVAHSGVTYFDLHQRSRSVELTANRIFQRVEEDPAFRPGMPLALPYGFPHGWLTRKHDTPDPTSVFVFLGMDVTKPTEEDLRRAADIAPEMPLWPRPGSVRVHDGVAVVTMRTHISARERPSTVARSVR